MFQDYFKGKDYPSHSLKFHFKNLTLLAAAQASVSCRLMFSYLYSNCGILLLIKYILHNLSKF